jgi:hypothetical protein
MATGIFNVVSDFAILILLTIAVWKLQIPFKQKIMIIVVLTIDV